MIKCLQLTSTALPELDPPALRVGSEGLSTGPLAVVKLEPEKQRFSQVAFPAIMPPK